MDLFEKIAGRAGSPIAQLSRQTHGRATFPRLSGAIGRRMTYDGRPHTIWNVNNYLGLANHPEVRAADAEAAVRYGLGSPMGSRMMSGETDELEALESELAEYAGKPAALFLNFGYLGMLSLVDDLLTRHDWLIYDAESHACILDGARLHRSRSRHRVKVFAHNDVERLERILEQVQRLRGPDEAVLVVTEGVFGMSGVQGRLRDIVKLKERYNFRLLVDDAHGFGVLGPDGRGTGEEQGVQDGIDLYFATFAKAGASIGAFVASQPEVIWQLRYGMRSQVFARGLPMPIIVGNRVRLRLMRTESHLRRQCLAIARTLRTDLTGHGLNIGDPRSAVTPVFLPMSPDQAAQYVDRLRERYDLICSAVVYPVVPRGVVQLRLIATAEHTLVDASTAAAAIAEAYEEFSRDSDLSGAAA